MDHLADCNLVFTILFTIECAMKLTSFGPKVNINISMITAANTRWLSDTGRVITFPYNFTGILQGFVEYF